MCFLYMRTNVIQSFMDYEINIAATITYFHVARHLFTSSCYVAVKVTCEHPRDQNSFGHISLQDLA